MEPDVSSDRQSPHASTPPQKSAAKKFTGSVRWLLIQLLSVIGILLAIEIVLLLVGVEKLESLKPESASGRVTPYPTNPTDFVRIAIFGGSAAAGAYSPRGFDAVLEHQLSRRFPNKQIYVRNYAKHGYPFHRHQAEYVKELIDRYDFFLIYCGNNEAENWYDDSGYWRIPEYKSAKDLHYLKPPGAAAAWAEPTREWLTRHSRMFAIATRVKRGLEPPLTKNRNRDYDEFEPQPSLPKNARQELVANFAEDLRQISQLAERYDKQILVSVTATYETWPPSFSTFREDITPDEKSKWTKAYRDGLMKFELMEFDEALSAWEGAATIDPDVAILNHRIGLTYLQLGNNKLARQYLRRAIDHEGHYFRSIGALHQAARNLAEQQSRLHYVDVEGAFHQATKAGITDDDLFVDVCHPSFLGHVIMGETFLTSLLQLEPFSHWSTDVKTANDTAPDWKQVAGQLRVDLGIDANDEAISLAGVILYHFDISHFCAYPDRCYEQIRKLIHRLETLRGDEPMAKTFAAVSRARLALQDDHQEALRELNLALEISPEYLETILELKAWNHYVGDEFEQADIRYSSDKKGFTLEP